MLGIDFPELVVIAVVALIVIGPEHLPKVARTVGHLWGRAQRYINTVKSDISRDMALDELRKTQQLAQQEIGNLGNTIHQATQEIEQQVSDVETGLVAAKYDLGQPITEANTVSNTSVSNNIPRHEIIEEHHAVMPDTTTEHKNNVNT